MYFTLLLLSTVLGNTLLFSVQKTILLTGKFALISSHSGEQQSHSCLNMETVNSPNIWGHFFTLFNANE